jgi:hypothetical protein
LRFSIPSHFRPSSTSSRRFFTIESIPDGVLCRILSFLDLDAKLSSSSFAAVIDDIISPSSASSLSFVDRRFARMLRDDARAWPTLTLTDRHAAALARLPLSGTPAAIANFMRRWANVRKLVLRSGGASSSSSSSASSSSSSISMSGAITRSVSPFDGVLDAFSKQSDAGVGSSIRGVSDGTGGEGLARTCVELELFANAYASAATPNTIQVR